MSFRTAAVRASSDSSPLPFDTAAARFQYIILSSKPAFSQALVLEGGLFLPLDAEGHKVLFRASSTEPNAQSLVTGQFSLCQDSSAHWCSSRARVLTERMHNVLGRYPGLCPGDLDLSYLCFRGGPASFPNQAIEEKHLTCFSSRSQRNCGPCRPQLSEAVRNCSVQFRTVLNIQSRTGFAGKAWTWFLSYCCWSPSKLRDHYPGSPGPCRPRTRPSGQGSQESGLGHLKAQGSHGPDHGGVKPTRPWRPLSGENPCI